MINIDKYIVTNLMKQGKKTSIYRGLNIDGENVIIKVLNTNVCSYDDQVRFQHEIYLTNLIRPVESTYSIKGDLCMIMPDRGGVTLHKLIENNELSLKQKIDLAIKITVEIGKIHEKKIIHKDINPSNVLIEGEEKAIKIIDFGIATELSVEKFAVKENKLIEGTMAYLAPEQTGRMNRSIDYRSDYYALGITLYYLLSNRLPFMMSDITSLIHSHIAVEAISLEEIRVDQYERSQEKDTIKYLSLIVEKLMSKAAEDRYQGVIGIVEDLKLCMKLLNGSRSFDDLIVGQNDVSEIFKVREKLYGREENLLEINDSYDRVCKGSKELLLIKGYSGIGKSSLINEFHKTILANKGYFIQGKYDQFLKGVPYSAIKVAFNQFLELIFIENQDVIENMKTNILNEVGENGKILTNFVPELESFLGKQPDLPVLGLNEEKIRFDITMQKFFHSLGTSERPFILFLDDLQWIDEASLKLIELTMTDLEVRNMMILGAYRDNEVTLGHPLLDVIDQIKTNNENLTKRALGLNSSRVIDIYLQNLEKKHVTQMLSESLNLETSEVEELSSLTYSKTEGNPFFTIQFLNVLFNKDVIKFDRDLNKWTWNSSQIMNYHASSNVVELMFKRVKDLSLEAQTVLSKAACIGITFELDRLSTVCNISKRELVDILWTPLKDSLILPLDNQYKYIKFDEKQTEYNPSYIFAHDRLQQAAYSVIDESEREKIHLGIARLMFSEYKNNHNRKHDDYTISDERLFDLVKHYNLAFKLIDNEEEKLKVLRLNIKSGEKAISAGAYGPAKNYLDLVLKNWDVTYWKTYYEETKRVYLLALESSYYSLSYSAVDELVITAVKYIKTPLEMVDFYTVRIKTYIANRQLNEAISLGLQILSLLKVKYPQKPSTLYTLYDFMKTEGKLKKVSINQIFEMEVMKDENAIAVCEVISSIISTVYIVRPDILPLLVFTFVKLNLKYGLFPDAALFPVYGMIVHTIKKDAEACYNYGNLAYRLASRPEFKKSRAQNIMTYYTISHHWKKHVRESVADLKENYRAGMEVGDLEYAGWCLHMEATHKFFTTRNIIELDKSLDRNWQLLVQLKNDMHLNIFGTVRQIIKCMIDPDVDPLILSGEFFDSDSNERTFEESGDRTTAAAYYMYKFILSYTFGDFDNLENYHNKVLMFIDATVGLAVKPFYYAYAGLGYVTLYNRSGSRKYLKTAKKIGFELKKWSIDAPMNNIHRYYLIKAELESAENHHSEAIKYYQLAIEHSIKNGYMLHEALSYELYAKYCYENNYEQLGDLNISKSYATYSKWGARNKVIQMREEYEDVILQSHIETKDLNLSSTFSTDTSNVRSSVTSSSHVDFTSSVKVFQAIANEVKLDVLLKKIMTSIIENAGAQKGFLLIKKDNAWSIEANGAMLFEKNKCENIFQDEAGTISDCFDCSNSCVPITILKYVIQSKETIVLGNAKESNLFINDRYINKHSPKSVICSPLIHQGRVNGVLYLENNLVSNSFSEENVEILNILSSQAAISLENAILYESLEKKVIERTLELQNLSEKYQELSVKDQLTKIYNRRKTDEVLNDLYDKSKDDSEIAVVLMDIDNFKNVNDTFGHLVGDEVLIKVAEIVKSVIRERDIFGRWGGEEFIIICPETSLQEAYQVSERIRKSIDSYEFDDIKELTCSFGIAPLLKKQSVDDTLNNVDTALYEAKENGRNRVIVFGE